MWRTANANSYASHSNAGAADADCCATHSDTDTADCNACSTNSNTGATDINADSAHFDVCSSHGDGYTDSAYSNRIAERCARLFNLRR